MTRRTIIFGWIMANLAYLLFVRRKDVHVFCAIQFMALGLVLE